MKDSEVFREARNVLFERGHAKGQFQAPDGSVCVNGACNIVRFGRAKLVPTGINYLHEDVLSEAVFDLGLLVPFPFERNEGAYGAVLNDRPSTTIDTMLEVLERAAKIAEQREADVQ